MILIMTNKEDVHPTPVIKLLAGRGVPVFRLNTEALLTDYEYTWWAKGNDIGFRIRCRQNGLELEGDKITAIWDRRPEPPQDLPYPADTQQDRHNREEARGFLQFLRYYLKDIPSIGSIVNDRVAASKMLQARIASQVGFRLPDTCYTNREESIRRFAAKHDILVLKPIENNGTWDENEGTERLFYTRKIPADALRGIPREAFEQTVNFVQEYVEKAYELRVTVVGEKVFACRIESQAQQEDEGKTDWRQGYEHGLRFTTHNLSEDIAGKCRDFLRQMGLRFGAFDLIVTPDGGHVFLECNPNGQWLWVELATGMPISEAIADELMKQEPAPPKRMTI